LPFISSGRAPARLIATDRVVARVVEEAIPSNRAKREQRISVHTAGFDFIGLRLTAQRGRRIFRLTQQNTGTSARHQLAAWWASSIMKTLLHH